MNRSPRFGPLHRECSITHAIRRLFERKNMAIARGEYNELCDQCRAAVFPHVANTRDGLKVYRIKFRSSVMYGIWCEKRDCIVTFYPTDKWLLDKGVVLFDTVMA